MLKINICIPVYLANTTYLERCISSVTEQTYANWSLTIIDGSEDRESLITQVLAKFTDHQISYLKNHQPQGIGNNWNFALDSSSDRYAMLLHEDDYLEKNFLAELITLVDHYPDGALYFCNANIIDATGNRTHTLTDFIKQLITPRDRILCLTGEQGVVRLLKGCFIICPTIIYDRTQLHTSPFDTSKQMVLDLDLYFRVLMAGGTIVGLNKKIFNYRRHSQSQTSRMNRSFERFKEEIAIYKEVEKKCASWLWSEGERVARQKTILKLHILYTVCVCLVCMRFHDLGTALKILLKVYKA